MELNSARAFRRRSPSDQNRRCETQRNVAFHHKNHPGAVAKDHLAIAHPRKAVYESSTFTSSWGMESGPDPVLQVVLCWGLSA